MTQLTSSQIWGGIDALAKKQGISTSRLAIIAGLDATSLNKSKRFSKDGHPRWPGTEALAKCLNATNVSLAEFAAMIEPKLNTPAIPEGFIPWHGGKCPVAHGVEGKMLLREKSPPGKCWRPKDLSQCYWKHDGTGNDIIAYRPIRPDGFQLEAGKYYITETGERVGPMDKFISTDIFHSQNLRQYCKGEWRRNGDRTPAPNMFGDIICLAADQGDAP